MSVKGKKGKDGESATIVISGPIALSAKSAYEKAQAVAGTTKVCKLLSWAERSQVLRSGLGLKGYVEREVAPNNGRNAIQLDPTEAPSNFLKVAEKSRAFIASADNCAAVRVKPELIMVLFSKGCTVANLRELGAKIGVVFKDKADLPKAEPLEGWQAWKDADKKEKEKSLAEV